MFTDATNMRMQRARIVEGAGDSRGARGRRRRAALESLRQIISLALNHLWNYPLDYYIILMQLLVAGAGVHAVLEGDGG